MKKLIILLALIVNYGMCNADTRIVCETSYTKAVNWHSGAEIVIRGTTTINDAIDLKYGVSEQYAGVRSAPFNLNHDARRIDIGFMGRINEYLQIGYTHSERIPFPGANTESIYQNHSLDTFAVRWQVDIK